MNFKMFNSTDANFTLEELFCFTKLALDEESLDAIVNCIKMDVNPEFVECPCGEEISLMPGAIIATVLRNDACTERLVKKIAKKISKSPVIIAFLCNSDYLAEKAEYVKIIIGEIDESIFYDVLEIQEEEYLSDDNYNFVYLYKRLLELKDKLEKDKYDEAKNFILESYFAAPYMLIKNHLRATGEIQLVNSINLEDVNTVKCVESQLKEKIKLSTDGRKVNCWQETLTHFKLFYEKFEKLVK